ncbi:MAG: phenylalanine--tRNA ligase subunit beta [Candidatus Magasanikbacteria bacterium CG_4_10_14_0_2_um_filter_33_14]|uniref:Phenylalanine--tRNA ligase beta subunit n=1 Tax=Candidatus Magasanikbacteria bacterium CG_4_10_14_0_2_um_filter_33_14 TaxID=1974636 RepID=A0A2M7VAW6_9BACT|nr:MAG: phenylalanine--tRNA ligase subunit beta [Candidatus Magasanikbacteria bacterium CG_4_10_14_0_2_um_filter_33_14]
MKVSLNWLKQYLNLPESISADEFALKLTMSTVEVEEVEKQGEHLENIILGEITKIEAHPDADKLKVCTVSDAQENFQVVCGGINVAEKMKIAFAKVGSKVRWHGEGELVELAKAKIRGVESYGMICASDEIGLGEMFPSKEHAEILDLSMVKAKVGTPLAKALELSDVVLDIDNKSMTHRPDLWGHYGMAREVAAIFHKDLAEYNPAKVKESKEINLNVKVEDTKLCPRYMGVVVDGIEVAESPAWLKQRLSAVGLRPINNIVDITNYIMYDLGQPMHAFDSSKVESQKSKVSEIEILVRKAKDDEDFVALDGSKHKLTSEMLVIADNEKVIALAGVMGGENTEVTSDTKTIIFESANFEATTVRRAAQKLALRSDSSARFEKSLDPNNADLALLRAVELTLEFCPNAKVVSKVVDEKSFHVNQGPIEMTLEFLERKIGQKIETKEIIKILVSLGFEVTEKKNILSVKIPTWRATKDISIAEDLVEEISRIYGFGNIEVSLPEFTIAPPEKNKLKILQRRLSNVLINKAGYNETLTYSFVSPNILQKLNFDLSDYIELDNPIAKDRPFLRRSILPNLLESLEKNIHEVDEVCLFEVGKVFKKEEPGVRISEKSDELLPRQDTMLGVVFANKKEKIPFYEMSQVVTDLFAELNLGYSLQENSEIDLLHPARNAKVLVGDVEVGFVGELHPALQNNFGIESRTSILELNLDKLLNVWVEKDNYKRLSQYPSVLRDVALLVDKKNSNLELLNTIQSVSDLITSVELFDVFESDKIGKDKKSMAYHITYQSNEKTLETEEVERVHEKVLEKLKKSVGAEVR